MTSPISPELSSQISLWRAKAAEGTLTVEDEKAIIIHLRQGRIAAANASAAAKRKKAIIAIPSAADLLDDMENM